MKNIALLITTTITLGAILPLAQATPISTPLNITVSGIANAVAAPKSDLGNFGDATVLSWLTGDITAYNSLNGTAFGTPSSASSLIGLTSAAGGNSITLNVSDHDYLFLHWGGQNGGWAQAFYVGNLSGSFTFDNAPIGDNPQVGGLSFYSFYTGSVPDGGSTALMLGLAFSGMGMARCRLKHT